MSYSRSETILEKLQYMILNSTKTGKKIQILKNRGWYRNMRGRYINPHTGMSLSRREITHMNKGELI